MMTFSRSLEDLHKWHCVLKSINHIDIDVVAHLKRIYLLSMHSFNHFIHIQTISGLIFLTNQLRATFNQRFFPPISAVFFFYSFFFFSFQSNVL